VPTGTAGASPQIGTSPPTRQRPPGVSCTRPLAQPSTRRRIQTMIDQVLRTRSTVILPLIWTAQIHQIYPPWPP
jgi:hypothetical protein